MGHYVFTARDQEGRHTAGTVEAPSLDAALKLLSGKNLLVTRIGQQAKGKRGTGKSRVSGSDLLAFTQELAALLDAGINIKHTMEMLAEDASSPGLRQTLIEISAGIEAGKSLAELMERYPRIFSRLYVSMIAIGESTGTLPQVLARLAIYIDNAETLRRKVKATLSYPAIVLVFAALVLTFIMWFGIPRVEKIYKSMGVELPLPTRIVIAVSHFSTHTLAGVAAAAILFFVLLPRVSQSKGGRHLFDRLKLRVYGLAPIFRALTVSRFARTLGTLYGGGVPILQCMELLKGSVGNAVVEDAIMQSLQNLKEGRSMTEPLRRCEAFSQMAIGMIAAGEEAGALERMLNKLADFYETQLDISVKGLSGILEPLLMIFIGVVIGGVVFALGLPFLNIASVIKP